MYNKIWKKGLLYSPKVYYWLKMRETFYHNNIFSSKDLEKLINGQACKMKKLMRTLTEITLQIIKIT